MLDNLREKIQFEESVAMKSAILLKLLEVGLMQIYNEIQYVIRPLAFYM